MKIIIALDIFNKKLVRLIKGEYKDIKTYNKDPYKYFIELVKKGIREFNIIDLNKPLIETKINNKIINKILKYKNKHKNQNILIRIGGGIRDIESIKYYLNKGASYIILSTCIFNKTIDLKKIKPFAKYIFISIDYKKTIRIKGWKEKIDLTIDKAISYINKIGIKNIILTDINNDGTLKGLNLNNIKKINKYKDKEILISGGFSSIKQAYNIKKNFKNIKGIICGKYLFNNKKNIDKIIKFNDK